MKTPRLLLCLSLLAPTLVQGQQVVPASTPGAAPSPAVSQASLGATPAQPKDVSPDPLTKPAEPGVGSAWNVRAEMLMVEVPTAQALAWLPELREDGKIEAVYGRILAAIEHKEAWLIGYPIVQTKSGSQATSETIDEFIYPTQYQPPMDLTTGSPTTPVGNSAGYNYVACPTNFEKRNLGATLQIEANVRPGGR